MHNKFMNERKLAYYQIENICFDGDFLPWKIIFYEQEVP